MHPPGAADPRCAASAAAAPAGPRPLCRCARCAAGCCASLPVALSVASACCRPTASCPSTAAARVPGLSGLRLRPCVTPQGTAFPRLPPAQQRWPAPPFSRRRRRRCFGPARASLRRTPLALVSHSCLPPSAQRPSLARSRARSHLGGLLQAIARLARAAVQDELRHPDVPAELDEINQSLLMCFLFRSALSPPQSGWAARSPALLCAGRPPRWRAAASLAGGRPRRRGNSSSLGGAPPRPKQLRRPLLTSGGWRPSSRSPAAVEAGAAGLVRAQHQQQHVAHGRRPSALPGSNSTRSGPWPLEPALQGPSRTAVQPRSVA